MERPSERKIRNIPVIGVFISDILQSTKIVRIVYDAKKHRPDREDYLKDQGYPEEFLEMYDDLSLKAIESVVRSGREVAVPANIGMGGGDSLADYETSEIVIPE